MKRRWVNRFFEPNEMKYFAGLCFAIIAMILVVLLNAVAPSIFPDFMCGWICGVAFFVGKEVYESSCKPLGNKKQEIFTDDFLKEIGFTLIHKKKSDFHFTTDNNHYLCRMKLTIKNLKYNEALSQETPCFSCDLYDDGVLVAKVSNNGCGGSNSLYPCGGLKYNDIDKYGSLDVETDIFGLVYEMALVKKEQRKGVVIKKGEDIFIHHIKPSLRAVLDMVGGRDKVLKLKEDYISKGYEVLNTNI